MASQESKTAVPGKKQKNPRQKTQKKSIRNRRLRGGLYAALTLAVISGLAALIVGAYVVVNVVNYRNQSPVIDLEKERNRQSQTSFIYTYDKNEELVELARLHGTENRVWVDLGTMPKYLTDAAIALEDKRFEKHQGVDWIRTLRVVLNSDFDQGGSTITQQLIKNLTGEKENTVVRKYKEIIMALNMDKNYTKDKILEAYLNTLYLGNGCYGVRTAAETYFGKDVDQLNLAECAVLVSITKAPSQYDPLRNPEENRKRQLMCLDYMLEQGKIGQEEYDAAVAYHLIFTNSADYVADPERQKNAVQTDSKINSYFVDYVIDCVIADLMKTMGYTRAEASDKLYYGGLKIYSTMDIEAQKEVEYVYENRIGIPSASATATAKNPGGTQASITVMDYEGRIVAMAGGLGEKMTNRGLNRALSLRQPGSTIKPLSTYAPALEYNEIRWNSTELNYAILYKGKRFPQNVDNTLGNNQMVSMKEAVAKSYNTVPVRILQKMGLQKSFDFLKNNFHFVNLDERWDVDFAPLATGSLTNGTNTVEMAAAYATFGNNGRYYEPHPYSKVLDGANNNTVIIDYTNQTYAQAISPATADIVQELLKGVSTSDYGSAKQMKRFEVMAKTGTTQDKVDRWFCLGTPHYVSAAWYGYDVQQTVQQSTNGSGLLSVAVHDRICKNLADKTFVKSSETVKKYVCNISGLLATKNCGSTSEGWFDVAKLPGTCSTCEAAPDPAVDENAQTGTDEAGTQPATGD